MGKLRKTLALGTFAGLVVPPIVAAIAKERIVPVDDEEADEVALVTIFDGGRFTSRSKAFRGGTALCWYGGSDIDLREARLDPAGARLQVRTIFGGVRIVVPDDWHVAIRSTPIFGGVSDDTAGGDQAGPRLDVDALSVFAGLRITNRLEDDDELIPPPADAATKGNGRGADEHRAEVLARAEVEADAEAEAAVERNATDAEPGAEEEASLAVETPADEPDPSASSDA